MNRITAKELFIPIAIVLAGLIVAVAIYVVRVRHVVENGTGTPEVVRPVSPSDHVIGNPSAPVAVIEYADIDSSYSKTLQLTMEQLMTEYADGGKVVWVYRHFPVTTEHPNAATHALAAECATSLSVPTTFFRFIDAIQAASPNENEFDPTGYPLILKPLGIDETAFRKCVSDGTFSNRVHEDYDNALAAGATGSPFVILLIHGQKPLPINGALPYASMKKIIDDAITQAG